MTALLPAKCLDETKPVLARRFTSQRRQSSRNDFDSSVEPKPVASKLASTSSFHLNVLPNPRRIKRLIEPISCVDENNIAHGQMKIMRDEAIWNDLMSKSCPLPNHMEELPIRGSGSQEKAFEKPLMKAPPIDKEKQTGKSNWQVEKEELMQRIRSYEKQLSAKSKKEAISEKMKERNNELETMLIQNSLAALESADSRTLKFKDLEKLDKPYVCFQLENGTIMYFDNVKPFSLFAVIESVFDFETSTSKCACLRETRIDADLKLLEGEFDCSFKGVIGNEVYFSAVRGRKVRFFKASILSGLLTFDEINEMKTSDLILFENEPMY